MGRYFLISAGYFVTYLYLFLEAPIMYLNDSLDYQRVAAQPLFSFEFWGATRPLTTPLFLKIFGNSKEVFVWFVFLLTVFSWVFFSKTVSDLIKHRRLKIFTFLLLLAVSLHKDLYFWAKAILSEGLSNALFILCLGLAFKLVDGFKKTNQTQRVLFFFPFLLLWAYTRDTNAYACLGMSGVLLGVAVFYKRKFMPSAFLFAVLCVGLFLFQEKSANLGGKQRWEFPMINIIGQRILIDSQKTRFFVEQGMPLNDKVLCFKGKWASSCNRDWSGFHGWVKDRGKPAYIKFLISRPIEHMWQPLKRWQDVYTSSVWGFSGMNEPKVWQKALGFVVYPKAYKLLFFGLLSLSLWVFALYKKGWDTRFAIPGILALLIYPLLFLNWHGDAMDVVRHSVGLVLQTKLALWLLFLFSLDILVLNASRNFRKWNKIWIRF